MPVKNTLFVLDFDGVIIDSLDEVVLVAYAATTGELPTSLAALTSGYADLFRKFRPLVQPAGDFLPFCRWCLQAKPGDQLAEDQFNDLLLIEPRPESERRQLFFETRGKLKNILGKKWVELHRPYEPLWTTLKVIKTPWFILTNKNKAAALELLRAFGLEFPVDRIFGGEAGTSKQENLAQIKRVNHDAPLTIIDDSIKNLLELSGDRWLASWGYTFAEDAHKAGKAGFRVVSQAELVAALLSWEAS